MLNQGTEDGAGAGCGECSMVARMFTDVPIGMQALLDMYTIKREIGRLEHFSIGLVGDLANGVSALPR